ncbi:hypothetical protein E3N88_04445 [Mikania micrantha]|uniref:Uncharacterized protein n=1 Tax=Mikania micrantha TaxID=192012 RepID=A0A5N6PVS5_9ASTR|nr:hypothetical protein E3N88_04445 [Mikania micrantha]
MANESAHVSENRSPNSENKDLTDDYIPDTFFQTQEELHTTNHVEEIDLGHGPQPENPPREKRVSSQPQYLKDFHVNLPPSVDYSRPMPSEQSSTDPKWVDAMKKEIKALEANETWSLEELPTEGCITFFPLWLAPSTIPQHNVVCLLHMPMHFVNLRLEGDYPIPTLSAVWKCYRNDAAGAWEMQQPQQQQPQQQPQHGEGEPPPPPPPPQGEGEPHQDVPHQHPERIYRAVRLPARVEAMLQGIADSTQQLVQQQAHMQQQQLELTQQLLQIQQQVQIQQQQVEQSQRLAHTSEQLTRRLDRLEDLISWHVHVELRHAQGEGI